MAFNPDKWLEENQAKATVKPPPSPASSFNPDKWLSDNQPAPQQQPQTKTAAPTSSAFNPDDWLSKNAAPQQQEEPAKPTGLPLDQFIKRDGLPGYITSQTTQPSPVPTPGLPSFPATPSPGVAPTGRQVSSVKPGAEPFSSGETADQAFARQVNQARAQMQQYQRGTTEFAKAKQRYMQLTQTPRDIAGGKLVQANLETGADILKKFAIAGEGLASGATLGISDLLYKQVKDATGVSLTPESTDEQIAYGLSRYIGGVLAQRGVTRGLNSLAGAKEMSLFGTFALTRLGGNAATAGIRSLTALATGNSTAKEAARDFLLNYGSALIAMIPENALPPGGVNFVAQVATDFVVDLIADGVFRDRFKDQTFASWFFKEELPSLVMSTAAAVEDFQNPKQLRAQQRAIIDRFSRRGSVETRSRLASLAEQSATGQRDADMQARAEQIATVPGETPDMRAQAEMAAENAQDTARREADRTGTLGRLRGDAAAIGEARVATADGNRQMDAFRRRYPGWTPEGGPPPEPPPGFGERPAAARTEPIRSLDALNAEELAARGILRPEGRRRDETQSSIRELGSVSGVPRVGATTKTTAEITPFIARTPKATTEFSYGNQKDGFKISTPDGARITGYVRNADFPGDVESPTRGELFYAEVPIANRRKGIGTALSLDGIDLLFREGARTVNLHATSPEGRAMIDSLVNRGVLSEPIRTSESRKSEHRILSVSSAAVDAYGIKLPAGYTRDGDRYVFRGESAAATPPAATPRSKDEAIIAAEKKLGFPLRRYKSNRFRSSIFLLRPDGQPYSKQVRASITQVVDPEHVVVRYSAPGKQPTYETVNINRLYEQNNQAKKRQLEERIRALPPENRKRIQFEAKEFDDLLLESRLFMGEDMESRKYIESGGFTAKVNKRLAEVKNQNREQAAKILGDETLDLSDPSTRAKHLEAIRDYIETNEKFRDVMRDPADTMRALDEDTAAVERRRAELNNEPPDSGVAADREAAAIDAAERAAIQGERPAEEPFSLESATPAAIEAERAAQRQKAETAERRGALGDLASKPLTGSGAGNLGQGDMFGRDRAEAPLFAPPAPQPDVAAMQLPQLKAQARAEGVEPTGNSQAIRDRITAKRALLNVLDRAEQAARDDLAQLQRPGTLGINKPLGMAVDYTLIGAVKLARGAVKFADWSAQMIAEFGEGIRPHLRAVWDNAHAFMKSGATTKEEARKWAEQRSVKLARAIEQAGLPAPAAAAVPPAQPTARTGFVPAAKRTTQDQYEQQFKQNQDNIHEWRKATVRKIGDVLGRSLVDRTSTIKRELEKEGAVDAIHKLVLREGSTALADQKFQDAKSAIFKPMERRDYNLFEEYIAAKRTVEATERQAERGVELKSPFTVDAARQWLQSTYQTKYTAEQRARVERASDQWWSTMREQLAELRKGGLIGEEAYQSLLKNHRNYSPRRFIQFIDPITGTPGGEKKFDSGVQALDKGSEQALVTDPLFLLSHVVTRTQSRIFKNRANLTLHALATQNPDNAVVRVLGRGEQARRDEGTVGVFVDGNLVEMAMPRNLAVEWNKESPAISQDAATWLQWITGTRVLKTLATGVNPEFAISNVPRDAAYAWFNSGQYNSMLPVGMFQLAKDYAATIKDAAKKTGAWRDYLRDGGGMSFLTTQGRLHQKARIEGQGNVVSTVSNILAYLGETSEAATRLAVRRRAMLNGKTPEEATFIARNMLDFSQGGRMTKAADNAIPYLNAAVQGTRGTFREFKSNPAQASFKAAQLAALGYGMAYAASALAPELWDSLSEREKATKWIIPLGFSTRDKNGELRHAYIAIPKDQFQQVFAAIGQSTVDAMAGKPWSQQMITATSSLMPVESASLAPPVLNSALAYFGNYDTWTKEKVWQGYDNISPRNEFTWRTAKAARDVSSAAKSAGIEISPDRLATAVTKIIPTSNPVGTLLMSVYDIPADLRVNNSLVEQLQNMPGARLVIRFSSPSEVRVRTQQDAERAGISTTGMTDRAARLAVQQAERERADMRQPLNVALDRFIADEQPGYAELRKWLRDNVSTQEERDRLLQRAQQKRPDLFPKSKGTGMSLGSGMNLSL
jgi:hypothetical protein